MTVPRGYEFEELRTTHGEISIEAIAPNGRRVEGEMRVVLSPDDAGRHEIGAIVRSTTDPEDRRIRLKRFIVAASGATRCTEPGPRGEMPGQRPLWSEPAAPSCSYFRVRGKGPVVFGHGPGRVASGWPQKIHLEVGLRPRAMPGYVVDGDPTVVCTSGTASLHDLDVDRPTLSFSHGLSIDTAPPRGERIVGGRHRCTVEVPLVKPTAGGEPLRTTRRGELRFEVDPHGYVQLQHRERCVAKVEPPEEPRGIPGLPGLPPSR